MDKISDLSGFSSRSDFYKACKQHLGLIPLNEEWHEIILILQNYFDGENSYLQTGFKLEDLSNDTKIPTYILSEFINNFYNMNFNEFINDKRLIYLQKQLQSSFDYHQYSINAIGSMLGFKSKSSFFTAIKKKSGLSPSDFIKQFSHRIGD
jgi:AraC-like DNA-binding protein